MTALTPHIRVLRALSVAFRAEADDFIGEPASPILASLADAHSNAAAKLEAEERELEKPAEEREVRYDPKAKRGATRVSER